jgi:hypothetical protein
MKLTDIEVNGPQLTDDEIEVVSGGGARYRTDFGHDRTMRNPRPKTDDHYYGGSDADRSNAPILD